MKRSAPGMSGVLGTERQPVAMTTHRAETSSPRLVFTVQRPAASSKTALSTRVSKRKEGRRSNRSAICSAYFRMSGWDATFPLHPPSRARAAGPGAGAGPAGAAGEGGEQEEGQASSSGSSSSEERGSSSKSDSSSEEEAGEEEHEGGGEAVQQLQQPEGSSREGEGEHVDKKPRTA